MFVLVCHGEAMHNDDKVDCVLETRIEKGFSLTTVSAGKNKMPVACAIKWETGYSMWKSNFEFTQCGSTDFIIQSCTLACPIKFVYADRSTVQYETLLPRSEHHEPPNFTSGDPPSIEVELTFHNSLKSVDVQCWRHRLILDSTTTPMQRGQGFGN